MSIVRALCVVASTFLALPAAAQSDWPFLVALVTPGAGRPHFFIRRQLAFFDAVGKLTYGQAQALGGNVRLFPTAQGTSPHLGSGNATTAASITAA